MMRMTMHEFVHGLDCKQVSAEITRLESALQRASEFAADMSGTCPYDMFDFRAKDCDSECDDSYAECWRRYFEKGDDSR